MSLFLEIIELDKSDLGGRKKLIQKHLEVYNDSWVVGNVRNPTGQSITCDLHTSQGEVGLLKIWNLKKKRNSKKRFEREVNILEKLKGKAGIVELYEYCIEKGTLILEKGEPLDKWWCMQSFDSSKERLVFALEILEGILIGLITLHNNGYSHRDIKPQNIIKIDNEYKLIDFGIALEIHGERLTEDDEKIGNIKTSPYPMTIKSKSDYYPYDLFQVSQVFLWLLTEEPSKLWNRPVDWRFISLDNFDFNDAIKIKAISAISAELINGIENAEQYLQLKNQLFFESVEEQNINTKRLSELLQNASANSYLSINKESSLATKYWPSFENLCRELINESKGMVDKYAGILRLKSNEKALEQLREESLRMIRSTADKDNGKQINFFSLECNIEPIIFSINCYIIYRKDSLSEKRMRLYEEGQSPYELTILRHTEINKDNTHRMNLSTPFLHNTQGMLEKFQSGEHIFNAESKEPSSVSSIINLINDLINDKEYIKLLGRKI